MLATIISVPTGRLVLGTSGISATLNVGYCCRGFRNMDQFMVQYLNDFRLQDQGDRLEKKWWPLVGTEFPSYEVFWRHYVVPFTNRIDSSISRSGREWIRVRRSVPDHYLQVMMGHYSVFYRVGRASEIVARPHIEYPEDVFDLLDSAGDNLKWFLQKLLKVGSDADAKLSVSSPDQFPKGFDRVFREIKEYRDTLLHNPVLGRAVDVGREYLPIYTKLGDVKELWRSAETLKKDELVESTALVTRLCKECKEALERIWATLLNDLEHSKLWDKLATTTALPSVQLGDAAMADRNPFYSPAASGTFVFPQKP